MTESEEKWVLRDAIAHIEGALKPATYVARAYQYARAHGGTPPTWARKVDGDHWAFERDYIEEDARVNRETMTVSDVAKSLGASRRTIQTWIDDGVLPALDGENRRNGAPRRIARSVFEQLAPRLRGRLETPPVVAFRQKRDRKAVTGGDGKAGTRQRKRLAKANRTPPAKVGGGQGPRRRARRRHAEAESPETSPDLPAPVLPPTAPVVPDRASTARLTEKRAEEAAARKRERALRAQLKAARGELRKAQAEREEAERAASGLTGEKRRAETRERGLVARLQMLLERARKRVVPIRRSPDAAPNGGGEVDRRRREFAAAAIEARLQVARNEHLAVSIAERMMNDVFDERIDRLDALLLFDELAQRDGIPEGIRVRVRKRFFGH